MLSSYAQVTLKPKSVVRPRSGRTTLLGLVFNYAELLNSKNSIERHTSTVFVKGLPQKV